MKGILRLEGEVFAAPTDRCSRCVCQVSLYFTVYLRKIVFDYERKESFDDVTDSRPKFVCSGFLRFAFFRI